MKAAIIGGSIGGLFAALFLRRAGVDVEIYERAETELAGRGAGIATHPEILDLLGALGLDVRDLGVTTRMRHVFARNGSVIAARERPQLLTSWDRLFALLRDALPDACYRHARELARIDRTVNAVTAHFADGSSTKADFLVGADGFRSTVRAQVLPNLNVAYVGYVAWRALVLEQDFPPALRDALFDTMAFCLPPGEQALGYPVAGADNDLRAGQRRYNFVWYRPADATGLRRLLTDETGITHDISIPPPLIANAVIASMREAANARLAPQLRDALRFAGAPFLQPIYDLEVPRMAFGRVALIGDAAFVARPHVGAGVVKAAGDAHALAKALTKEKDVPHALQAFEAARLPFGNQIVQRARDLGAYMQARRDSDRERAMAERYRDPAAVLADTATLDFL